MSAVSERKRTELSGSYSDPYGLFASHQTIEKSSSQPAYAFGGKTGTPAAILANKMPIDMAVSVPQKLAKNTTIPMDADLLSLVFRWIAATARSK